MRIVREWLTDNNDFHRQNPINEYIYRILWPNRGCWKSRLPHEDLMKRQSSCLNFYTMSLLSRWWYYCFCRLNWVLVLKLFCSVTRAGHVARDWAECRWRSLDEMYTTTPGWVPGDSTSARNVAREFENERSIERRQIQ